MNTTEVWVWPTLAAKIYGLSRGAIYYAMSSGRLRYSVVGKRRRLIKISDFEEYRKHRWRTEMLGRQCSRCESKRLKKDGFDQSVAKNKFYQRYKCKQCGYRSSKEISEKYFNMMSQSKCRLVNV